MWKAKFRTAYLQREIVMDAIVSTGDPVKVGSLVAIDWDGVNPAIVKPVVANDAKSAMTIATHIMAQSDMTMEYGHVPVENRDYRYSDEINPTIEGMDINSEFQGFYDSVAALANIAGPASGDTALVKITDGKYQRYIYNNNSWGVGNSVVYAEVKKIAVFAITEEDDVIPYDAEA